MLTLRAEVPEGRERTAVATLREGMRTVASGPAVATATQAFAAQHANPECDPLRLCGHPALGRYRLIHHEPAAPGQGAHYGTHVLLFEPQSGPALDAESFGRLGLLVFGGPPGRRTQGGVRVGNELLKTIVERISQDGEMTLEVVALRPRAWWQFWKAPDATSQALSGSLNPPQPPHDELTLLEALLQKAPRRPRDASDRDDTDRDRSFDRSDRSSGSSSGESFQGGGGQSGGAGASGRWDGPASGRGPGTDNTGRIVGAAAAVGAVAAAAAMASHAPSADGGDGASDAFSGASADTGTDTSTAY